MTAPEYLRATHAQWKGCLHTGVDCSDALAEVLTAAQPIIRATIASTIGRHTILRDEVESAVLEWVWTHLRDCHTDIVAWVRLLAMGRSIDALRKSSRSKSTAVGDLESVTPESTPRTIRGALPDMNLLTPRQRQVANLLLQGASRWEVREELHMSHRQITAAIDVIRNALSIRTAA
jgi:DNA-binding NarL/FixJ family response regulator